MTRHLVFGRRDAGDLVLLGDLEAEADELEKTALVQYGEEWAELTLVPEPAVRWVMGPAAKTSTT